MRIAAIDWTILAVGFLFFLAWAIYLNSKCRSVADYLVSGRKVRMWLGMGAGIGGEIGLLTIASICEQGYAHGFSFVFIALLSHVVTIPLFGIFGFGIQRFRASKAMSVPQYLEMRYSRNLRILTGMTNCLAGVIQMCIFPIVGATFVRSLMGAPEQMHIAGMSMPTDWFLMLILLICPIIFTTLGGYTTLIVTNFFQAIIITLALTWLLFLVVGRMGVQHYWSGTEIVHGISGLNPFASGGNAYGWRWFLWLNVMTILLQFSYGPYLQQYASMDKPKTVSRAILIGGIFGSGRSFIILGIGVAAAAAMGLQAPAHLAVENKASWDAMATPYFMGIGGIPPVLMGLLLLGLLFADVAVTDKYILSWSTSIVNDCIYPFRSQPFTPKQQIRAVRITILILCVIFFMFGLVYKPTMKIWDFMWLMANIIGGTGIAVLLGMYWKRASTLGAFVCVLTCVILPLADMVARRIHVGMNPGAEFFVLPQTTGLFTYLLAACLMVVFSLVSNEKSKFWDLGKAVQELNREKTATPVAVE